MEILDPFSEVVLFFGIVFLVVYSIIQSKKRAKLQEEEQARKRNERVKKLQEFITENKLKIDALNSIFENHLKIESGFFSNYLLSSWKKQANTIRRNINHADIKYLKCDEKALKSLQKFIEYHTLGEQIRNSFNKKFLNVELESYNHFFDDIEGLSLDKQQREAIIKDEDNSLIIAGAGTGKTVTIAGKVAYLVDRYNVDPSELLLISFTNKSCDVMKQRIRREMNLNVDVRTFNKLGFDIIKEVDAENHKSVCDLSTREILQIFNSFLGHLVAESDDYLKKFNRFFVEYLKPYKSDEEFKNKGEKIDYLKNQNLYGYKTVSKTNGEGKQYRYQERYKSHEEVIIANYLFLNGIEYEYESNYKFRTADKTYSQYRPDFYLPDYDIYIEHFAIDKSGNVPNWFGGTDTMTAKERYNAGIKWKREIHRNYQTRLIETYSWEKRDGILVSSLEAKLKDAEVHFKPKNPREIWSAIQEAAQIDIPPLVRLIYSFLTLFKANNHSLDDIKSRMSDLSRGHETVRTKSFLEIFEPIYYKYQQFLNDRDEIDFSDMINLASSYIEEGKYVPQFKYIIIDEFQDISLGRYRLVKSILDVKPSTKLFCVGDDWQSIYRFTGSDVSIFTDFKKYFNSSLLKGYKRATEVNYIETTYRFADSLIDISSSFILKNDIQIEKDLKSFTTKGDKQFSIISYDSQSKPFKDQLNNIFDDIKRKEGHTKQIEILLLGRYNHDIKMLDDIESISYSYDRNNLLYKVKCSESPNLSITFLTVHASKGTESDYVIIINGKSGKYGFPSEIVDDPLLHLLLNQVDQYPNGEERRVFYVAMTRTRKHLYLLANNNTKSKFISEIEDREKNHADVENCPDCKTGELEERNGEYGIFKGCSNYPYCNYTEKIDTMNY